MVLYDVSERIYALLWGRRGLDRHSTPREELLVHFCRRFRGKSFNFPPLTHPYSAAVPIYVSAPQGREEGNAGVVVATVVAARRD